jgi:hypothetical protein
MSIGTVYVKVILRISFEFGIEVLLAVKENQRIRGRVSLDVTPVRYGRSKMSYILLAVIAERMWLVNLVNMCHVLCGPAVWNEPRCLLCGRVVVFSMDIGDPPVPSCQPSLSAQ